MGQHAVFEEASTMLRELVGVAVSAKQIERLCHYFGQILEEQAAADEAPGDASGAGAVYGMVDGSMILTREAGWKEVKLGRLFAEEAHEEGQRGRIAASIYTAHVGHYEAFLSTWEAELASLEQQPLVLLADGAQWFWEWASAAYPEAAEILDYYHCKSYLWAFATVYFKGKKDQQRRADWVERQQDLLFEDQVETVIAEIEQLPRRGVEDLVARQKILSYFGHNRRRMYYGSYRRRGLLLGSGPIEAAHRNVIQHRLKLAGQRLARSGAQQVANLRVLRKSDRWENVIALTRTRKLAA